MTKYDNEKINEIFESNLNEVIECIKQLDIYQGNKIDIKGLKGWIFEQTIDKCIKNELSHHYIPYNINEQYKLMSRVYVDLKINEKILIEVKLSGFFNNKDGEKYKKYKEVAEKKNFNYLYLTQKETDKRYQNIAREVFGKENAFILNENNFEWERFINRIISLLKN